MVTKEIKLSYIDTGRLNRNLISKEVAISWYKCRLQNMLPDDTFKDSVSKGISHFDDKFIRFIDSIIPQMYQYILANDKLIKCSERAVDDVIKSIVSVDDLCIGTNAAYISLKTSNIQSVNYHEHYLNRLSEYNEVALPIHVDEKPVAVLSLFSKDKINEYDIIKIKDALLRYQQNENFQVELDYSKNQDKDRIDLIDYFVLPSLQMSALDEIVQKLIKSKLPIMIIGAEGTGKTTLSLLISLKKGKVPFIINYSEVPLRMQKDFTEKVLSQYDTVVLDNIEYCNRETISLLTVYSERQLEKKVVVDDSVMRDSSIIMTTGYKYKENAFYVKNRKVLSSLIEKMKFSTVNLVNTDVYHEDHKQLMSDMLNKNRLKCQDNELIKLARVCTENSFKEIQRRIDLASIDLEENIIIGISEPVERKIKSLDACEKEHILETLKYCEGNMTTAAEILGIGRATLYRKLQKYQNETH